MSEYQRFRLDIQGLRALAVVPVVLFHVDDRWMPGGFVGVDVFFVISGYLITRILLRELEGGRFSILGFYERRVKRLFPALYAMLGVTLLLGALILPPGEYAELGRTAAATMLFVSNIAFMLLSGYFDGAAELKPLLHTWSLAVEEQFYLAFPLILLAIYRLARRWMVAVLWLGFALSLGLCVWMMRDHASAAFYLPITRAYELLAGSIVAAGVLPGRLDQRTCDALSVAGIALIAAAIALLDSRSSFPGFAALLPCFGTAMVLRAGEEGVTSLGGRLLNHWLPVFFGSLSYSLYLWHWPLIVFSRYLALDRDATSWAAAAALLSVGCAYASWRWLEKPVLRRRIVRTQVLWTGGATMAIGLAAAALPVVKQGLPGRFGSTAQAAFAAGRDFNPRRPQCHANDDRPIAYDRACRFGADAPARVAIWGDSFGVEIAQAVGERLAMRGGAVVSITASSCPPALGLRPPTRARCPAHNRAALAGITGDPSIRTVVLVANYAPYRGAQRTALIDGLADSARRLVAAGKRLILVGPIPAMPFPAPTAVGLLHARGSDARSFGTARADHDFENRAIGTALSAIARSTGAAIVDPAADLCDETRCRAVGRAGELRYFDAVHLSLTGARQIARRLPI